MPATIGIILIVICAVAVLWYFLYRAGNPGFWKVAAKYPDEAYDWFMSEDCWIVVDPESPSSQKPEPRGEFTGPFVLWVPKLGDRRVAVYGRHDRIEESQRRFTENYGEQGKLGVTLPPLSYVALLHPVFAMLYAWISTPPSLLIVFGYGLANLGYVLFAAGIFAGTFLALGLKKRWQVFAAGIVAWLLGAFLMNLQP